MQTLRILSQLGSIRLMPQWSQQNKHINNTTMQSNFIKDNQEKIFLGIGFILVLSVGFFAGYFYSKERIDRNSIIIENPDQDCMALFDLKIASDNLNPDPSSNSNSSLGDISSAQVKGEQKKPEDAVSQNKTGMFVASRNSKIYHRPDCKYVNSIKEENKIWFQSADEAQKAGYVAHDCEK